MNMKTVKKSELILNIGLVILTVIGVILMFNGKPGEGVLQASGLANFKYYTVLTNVFCGLIAFIYMICLLTGKGTEKMVALKLGAVCGVAITFAVVAFMFGPLYGFPQFYRGGNFIFHLIEPLAAMVEFIVVRRKRMPFIYTVIAAVPTFIYGACYMLNILINGMGGEWPNTNDFYAFLNWGWPVGMVIFAVITLSAFGAASLFRVISNKRADG